jgi:hypothetical protein
MPWVRCAVLIGDIATHNGNAGVAEFGEIAGRVAVAALPVGHHEKGVARTGKLSVVYDAPEKVCERSQKTLDPPP